MDEKNTVQARTEPAPDFRDRMLDTFTREFDRLARRLAETDPAAQPNLYLDISRGLCEMASTAVKLRHADLSAWLGTEPGYVPYSESDASSERSAS